jgi:hypothetical protein
MQDGSRDDAGDGERERGVPNADKPSAKPVASDRQLFISNFISVPFRSLEEFCRFGSATPKRSEAKFLPISLRCYPLLAR